MSAKYSQKAHGQTNARGCSSNEIRIRLPGANDPEGGNEITECTPKVITRRIRAEGAMICDARRNCCGLGEQN